MKQRPLRVALVLAASAALWIGAAERAPADAGPAADVSIQIVGSAHDRGEIKPCG